MTSFVELTEEIRTWGLGDSGSGDACMVKDKSCFEGMAVFGGQGYEDLET